jgi:hypothetical protein
MSFSYRPLFAVVLNWNLSEDTIECVESLLDSSYIPDHIVVVDNGSTDNSVERFQDHFNPDMVSIICNRNNLGFAAGMNTGIRESLHQGANSVFLLNNDTVVAPLALRNLVKFGDSKREPLILGPAIYYYHEPDEIWKLGDIKYPWFPVPYSVKKIQKYRNYAARLVSFPVSYVTGCAMLIHREVFEAIGLFDERYFMYFEDADFCGRAQETKFDVWCVPESKIRHKVSKSADRDKPYNRYHRMLNQVRFYHEHTHGISLVFIEIYMIFSLIKMFLSDAMCRDLDLVLPTLKGLWSGYNEQLRAILFSLHI